MWADDIADQVIARGAGPYTCAAGISPSGVVHFGNFREIVTSSAVLDALAKKGKKARLLFSWDNFDRMRKVPAGVPVSWEQHIGKALSKVPCPCGDHESYAVHFQAPFEAALKTLGYDVEFRYQTDLYEAGTYDAQIFSALKRREEIADIMLSFMTDKAKGEKGIVDSEYRAAYYPISLYSRFSGKDSTKILSYDGATSVTYYCAESKNTETVDLSKDHIAKLAWKLDWPMRWAHEAVSFEPAGHDHASPGSSYDVGRVVSAKIFDNTPPVYCEYKFVGIQGLGAKMSGSKGNAVSPGELLEIYEPDLLKWIYTRKAPDQSFELAFNSEIYRQYEEYDKELAPNAIPFRQAVSFGQIVQWDRSKLDELLAGMSLTYDGASIERRLPLARAWLHKYNPDEEISLLAAPNSSYAKGMSPDARARITKLQEALASTHTIPDLEALVYDIPKAAGLGEADLKKAQRAFFADVYMLLIGRDTGPRLATFLWALDRQKTLELLTI